MDDPTTRDEICGGLASMLLRPDSVDPGDILTDTMMQVLLEGGATALSVRRLAVGTGYSLGGLMDRFGNRDRMLHVGVNVFRDRWNGQMRGRALDEGLMALLPLADGLDDCKVWHSFVELARTSSVVAECVAAQREDERRFIEVVGRGRLDQAHVDHLEVVARGLRTAMTCPGGLTSGSASALLTGVLSDLGVDARTLHDADQPLPWAWAVGF